MLLKQPEVVDSSLGKGGAKDLPVRLINHYLWFKRMLFFLATVIAALFFSMVAKLTGKERKLERRKY